MLSLRAPETLHVSSKTVVCVTPQPFRAPALKPCWRSKLNALGVLPPVASPSDSLGWLFSFGNVPELACMGFILFGMRAVFSKDARLFPRCMLITIPLLGVTDVVVTRDCTRY